MVLDLTIGMAVLALMGALAAIAGCMEDLETDVGSQSNANSQVQLAPQMGFLHRIFNKAISGEPVSYGFSAATGATVATVLLNFKLFPLMSIAIGSLIAAIVYGIFSSTAHASRIASQSRFKQPLYMDMVRYTIPSIISHNFVANLCIIAIAYLQFTFLGFPFPIPFLALIWGVTVGCFGSAIGDVHYGGERQYQNREFGVGLNTALSGRIVCKGESGLRSSIDNVWFCAKFGGPATGIGFALVVFLSAWPVIIFGYSWKAMILGFIIVILIVILNRLLEIQMYNIYGKYKEEQKVGAT